MVNNHLLFLPLHPRFIKGSTEFNHLLIIILSPFTPSLLKEVWGDLIIYFLSPFTPRSLKEVQ